jgi:hyperosmotically inducible protein
MPAIRCKVPALLILAAACALPARAEGPQPPPYDSPLFRKLDADRDGFVSRAEAKRIKGFDAAFVEGDENRDGRLSRDEFVRAESMYDRGQAALYLEDSLTTAKVKAALLKEVPAAAGQVSVETYRGRVLLSGFVDDERNVKRVREVAASVRGVMQVSSGLQVK